MATYKQVVLDIKDYISLETATINRLLERSTEKGLPVINRDTLIAERDALKDILDIIKEDGK